MSTTGHILIVDDDDDILTAGRLLLRRQFGHVTTCANPEQVPELLAGGDIYPALERGTIGFDAVKHLVLCRIEHRPPRLDMTVYPYLPKAHVAATSPAAYMSLLGGGRS